MCGEAGGVCHLCSWAVLPYANPSAAPGHRDGTRESAALGGGGGGAGLAEATVWPGRGKGSTRQHAHSGVPSVPGRVWGELRRCRRWEGEH